MRQGEGGEQGDPFMPALFCLGIHDVLHNINSSLHANEYVVAYLDDIYIIAGRDRTKTIYDELTDALRKNAGIEPNLGKTEAWSPAGGSAPVDIATLNIEGAPPVWKSDLSEELNGITVLGVPFGSNAFVEASMEERLNKQQSLMDQLHLVGKAQNEWLLLYYCCNPRATYFLRTGKPSQMRNYARKHDAMILKAFCDIMGLNVSEIDPHILAQIHLPLRMGGLGLRDHGKILAAAYWSSWADVLPLLCKRMPWYGDWFLSEMQKENKIEVFKDLHQCVSNLTTSGYIPPERKKIGMDGN